MKQRRVAEGCVSANSPTANVEAPLEQTPYWADLMFPVLSFFLTIVGPSVVALWVMVRVAKDMRALPRSTPPTVPPTPPAPKA